MVFEGTLGEVVRRVDGARGAAVINLDGVVVGAIDGAGETVAPDEVTPEYAAVFKQLLSVNEAIDLGEVERLSLRCEGHTVLLRRLSSEYAVLLRVDPETILGKAHFYLRLAAPDFAREL